jgi:cyclopropane-fatty-acyl-phospholipid synthase
MDLGVEAAERGLVPDGIVRWAIRRQCAGRLREVRRQDDGVIEARNAEFVWQLRSSPIAMSPAKANQQHYEIPAEFFSAILGPRLKYSCCFWPNKDSRLEDAEDAALEITCERAGIGDGQEILELGCGWGSLTLWMAERYPNSRVTAVSNSQMQRTYIEAEAAKRGIQNVVVCTADMNTFNPSVDRGLQNRFDRIVSIEMFEHMRNYELLLSRIATWLCPDGLLFVHVFCHRNQAYAFETEGAGNWMGRHFFTGGIMPSADLLRRFPLDLAVTQQWHWDGKHYQRTAEAWLTNLDQRRSEIMDIWTKHYGATAARRWLNRWRMFFLAVSEVFGFAAGQEWFVSHYRLEHAV